MECTKSCYLCARFCTHTVLNFVYIFILIQQILNNSCHVPCTVTNAFKNSTFHNIPLMYSDQLYFIFTLRLREFKQTAQGHTGSVRSQSDTRIYVCLCVCQSLSHIQLFSTPWTAACQDSLSMGLSRQEYWNGLLCPPPGDLPNPGIEPQVSCVVGRFFIVGDI